MVFLCATQFIFLSCFVCFFWWGLSIEFYYFYALNLNQTLTEKFPNFYTFIKTLFIMFIKLLAIPHNIAEFRFYYPCGDICSPQYRQKLTHTHTLFLSYVYFFQLRTSPKGGFVTFTTLWGTILFTNYGYVQAHRTQLAS